MSVESISCVDVVASILDRKGAQFIGWQVTTDLKLSGGKKCPVYGATKTCRVSGILGVDMARMENDELERMGKPRNYVAGPRQWGKHVFGTPFITHTLKDTGERKLYIQASIRGSQLLGYNRCNGSALDPSDVEPWIVQRPVTAVKYTDYSLSSIEIVYRAPLKGQEVKPYRVDHSDLMAAVLLF